MGRAFHGSQFRSGLWSWTNMFWFGTICMSIHIKWECSNGLFRMSAVGKDSDRSVCQLIPSTVSCSVFHESFFWQTSDSIAHDLFVSIFKVFMKHYHRVACFVNNVLLALSFLCAVLVPKNGKMGEKAEFDAETGQHHVRFFDDSTEWVTSR